MKVLRVGSLAILLFSAPLATAEMEDVARLFEDGRSAMAAGNMELGLNRMEAALRARPDDLRFGSEYRQAIIAAGLGERAVDFLEELVTLHPDAANARLNLGYAVVDQIPEAGAVTRVLLANKALEHFTVALELEESWLAFYTRGNSYLYWPVIFGRAPLAIADLERAIELSGQEERKPQHAKAWIALGDAHWRLDDGERAHEVWKKAEQEFPENPEIEKRLSFEAETLSAYLDAHFDSEKRVDTDLAVLWSGP